MYGLFLLAFLAALCECLFLAVLHLHLEASESFFRPLRTRGSTSALCSMVRLCPHYLFRRHSWPRPCLDLGWLPLWPHTSCILAPHLTLGLTRITWELIFCLIHSAQTPENTFIKGLPSCCMRSKHCQHLLQCKLHVTVTWPNSWLSEPHLRALSYNDL